MIFRDRADAGAQLALRLAGFAGDPNLLVVAIPRGGVEIGAVIARALHAPLDVVIAKKIGAPFMPEFAIGAVSHHHVAVLNEEIVRRHRIDPNFVALEAAKLDASIADRYRALTGREGGPRVAGKTVLLTDDGIATGLTTRAAIRALRLGNPGRLILAVPVVAWETARDLAKECDEVVALLTPHDFRAVGEYYLRFPQLTDDQVVRLLQPVQYEENSIVHENE